MSQAESAIPAVDVATLVEAGLSAVLAAGPICLDYFRSTLDVEDKSLADPSGDARFDPVTEADRRTEQSITRALLARFPDHRVVGEEHGTTNRPTEDGRRPDVTWIIDPIDGTRSFISGMPTWGILLGLVIDGEPVAGIMHQPFTEETYISDPTNGSRLLHRGHSSSLATRSTATLSDAIVFSTHPHPLEEAGALPRFLALADRCRLQRWGGDCYSFALLAGGTIDVVVDGMLKPYDIVPLIPIVERAGGRVSDLDGTTTDGRRPRGRGERERPPARRGARNPERLGRTSRCSSSGVEAETHPVQRA